MEPLEGTPAQVLIAPVARDAIRAIGSKADAKSVRRRLLILPYVPEIGHVYDPVYEAARPPHDVLVTYAGHYGIYYVYDADSNRISVEYILDQRTDPTTRF